MELISDTLTIIVSFFIGIIFSPWSAGLSYFIMSMILYEILIYYMWPNNFNKVAVRLATVFVSMVGFVVGRLLVGHNYPLDDNPRLGKPPKRPK